MDMGSQGLIYCQDLWRFSNQCFKLQNRGISARALMKPRGVVGKKGCEPDVKNAGLTGREERLIPHTLNPGIAQRAPAIFYAHVSHLKSPALNDDLTASGAEGVFTAVAGHIAGIDVF